MRQVLAEMASYKFTTTTSGQRTVLMAYFSLDTINSSALMFGLVLLVIVWEIHMSRHVSLQETITEISR
jgi:hypothetical protein